MELSAALVAALALLTEALNEPGIDIETTLRMMSVDSKAAVDSFVGLSLRLTTRAAPLSFTTFAPDSDSSAIATSLLIPLSRSPGATNSTAASADPSAALILYAGRAGAFVDLAADLAWLTGADLKDFVLDRNLQIPDASNALDLLLEQSTVNQAIGVLVGDGFSPSEAALELDARAAEAGTNRHDIATQILAFPDEETA